MKIEYRLQENVALDYAAIPRGSPEEDGEKEPWITVVLNILSNISFYFLP